MDANAVGRAKDSAAAHIGLIASIGAARAALRRATADIHEALHRQPTFARLMGGHSTMGEYCALLACLYGFHYPLERALRAIPRHLATPIDLVAREKAHLLHQDLAALGVTNAAIEALPQCPALPEFRSAQNIVGCLYVVEGAGLGGHIIARKLDYLLGGKSVTGRRFFLGRPDPDPLPWPAFCRSLEAYAEKGDLDEIADGARRTFAAIQLWLSQRAGDV